MDIWSQNNGNEARLRWGVCVVQHKVRPNVSTPGQLDADPRDGLHHIIKQLYVFCNNATTTLYVTIYSSNGTLISLQIVHNKLFPCKSLFILKKSLIF